MGGSRDHVDEFEVAGMQSECDRRTVLLFHASNGGENDELFPHKLSRIPAHSGVLGHTKVVAARLFDQEFSSERDGALGAVGVRLNFT